jgi:hypothetical protein
MAKNLRAIVPDNDDQTANAAGDSGLISCWPLISTIALLSRCVHLLAGPLCKWPMKSLL